MELDHINIATLSAGANLEFVRGIGGKPQGKEEEAVSFSRGPYAFPACSSDTAVRRMWENH